MKKAIPTIFLLVATILSASTMLKIDQLEVKAKEDTSVFLKEVRKPEGSGYIFDDGEGVNISVDK